MGRVWVASGREAQQRPRVTSYRVDWFKLLSQEVINHLSRSSQLGKEAAEVLRRCWISVGQRRSYTPPFEHHTRPRHVSIDRHSLFPDWMRLGEFAWDWEHFKFHFERMEHLVLSGFGGGGDALTGAILGGGAISYGKDWDGLNILSA